MSRRLRILREAAEEATDAALYLESEREGFGLLFFDEYEETLDQIRRHPLSAPVSEHSPEGTELRLFLIRRFLYVVVAGELDGVLTVVAVASTRRDQGYWRGRLRDREPDEG